MAVMEVLRQMSNNRSCGFAAQLSIVYRLASELKPNSRNPRKHSKKQLSQLTKALLRFGFIVPVLVNAQGEIVAGHGRIEAAKLAGIEQVPTISVDHLTDAEATAFMIADNKLTENAEWNEALLGEHFQQLAALNLDFSLEITGFEMPEIDLFIEGLSAGNTDAADEIPNSPTGVQVSRLGDIWLLGPHRVLCGDARDPSCFEQLMQGKKAGMVFTDPPYNVRIDGNVSGKGAIRHEEFVMASGEMSATEFTEFLADVLKLLVSVSKDGSLHFVCMDWRHIGELLSAGKQTYADFKNLCVWTKDRAGMGSLYRSQHELVFVFKHGTGSHTNNIQLGQFGRYRTNVWQYPSAVSFGHSNDEGNLLELHPTVKPVAMVADAMLDCSKRGEIVLDSFLGSGTSVIAAERTGRRCYGLDLDPAYVDVVIRRWQAFTGKNAEHEESGRTFAAIEQEVKHG